MNIYSREMYHHLHRLQSQEMQKREQAMKRLSTGLRINKAGDDAAGLQISERLKSQVKEAKTKQDNIGRTLDAAKSVMSIYDSTIEQLQRIRELQVQYNNDTYSASDKKSIENKMNKLLDNIEQSRKNFTFNNIPLLSSTSLHFENSSGTTIPYGNGIQTGTEPHTFTFWAKTDYTKKNAYQLLLFSTKGTVNSTRLYVSLTNDKWSTGIQGQTGDAPGMGTIRNNDEWTHLSLVMDGNEAKLYVNGELASTRSYTNYTTGADFEIGNMPGGVIPPQGFFGEMDDLHIYNRVLSESEINSDRSGDIINSLIGDWTFEEKSNLMKDYSSNGYDGQNTAATATEGSGGIMKLDSQYAFKIPAIDLYSLNLDSFNPSDSQALNKIDKAINIVSVANTAIGSAYNRMQFEYQNKEIRKENSTISLQRVRESDISKELSEMTQADLLINIQTSMQTEYIKCLRQKVQLLEA